MVIRCVSVFPTVADTGAEWCVASNLLECAEAHENFFKNTVIGNEIWMYSYNPKTKCEYASEGKTVN